MAREAEEAAKEFGRNALGIAIQRRSGSITRAVVPFTPHGRVRHDPTVWNLREAPIEHFRTLVSLLAEGKISARIASLFRSEVDALHPQAETSPSLWEVACALAERVVTRRESEAAEEVRPQLRESVLALGQALHERDARGAIARWCEALTAAAFLARGE
jgi:hypothetical protein